MNDKQTFIQQGFSVLDTENKENKLIHFLKEHYPQVLKDGELNLTELKTVLGLPIDEKVNGYGLNFVGRGVARAKYAQETQKELLLNRTLSKNTDTTQNMVLKGDNLDSLKLLKPHYSGKIKCIYIDPPYNTSSDEFVYPDKFDREEAEVLGVADSLSEEDFDRMEFSFKTKKSHNGWLAFMYPRLLLARDLLAKDGVIFISIDDNEQANLKLLCDEIFGEENFVGQIVVAKGTTTGQDSNTIGSSIDYMMMYGKSIDNIILGGIPLNEKDEKRFNLSDEKGKFSILQFRKTGTNDRKEDRPNLYYKLIAPDGSEVFPIGPTGYKSRWRTGKETFGNWEKQGLIYWKKDEEEKYKPYVKYYLEGREKQVSNLWNDIEGNKKASITIKELFGGEKIFDFPKPIELIKRCLIVSKADKNDIILDFFAGSGTTGHAVMALNAEDGGNRKFILCQIDEPIAEGKPAYQFCIDNDLPPVISSITIERLRRAGEQIGSGDTGFKVFDHTDAPKLTQDENGQIVLPTLHNDALSRIYTMIFKVGLDEPSQVPQEVLENCIYKIGHHYYITNSEQISKDDFATAIKDATQNSGKIFIDGWTASLNATLQHYKEEVQIVF
ncbi:site-specific DNA-methyltransferase [Capnocytophaga cynodegmi]|uniref:site-specific DNA-methyltransferase n=1 Tax=Capnocytophaga cynodegmi TaxID=28189 RepID=UPI0037D2F37D